MNDAPSLEDSLARWTGFPKLERRFEPRRTRAAAVRVTRQLGDLEPKSPEPYDLEALYWRVMGSWRRHGSLEGVSSRDLQRLPWVLFYQPRARGGPHRTGSTGWLGGKPRVVQDYRRWLSRARRARSAQALLHEFLRVYPTNLQTFGDLRETLQVAVVDSPSPPPSLRKWRQRCLDYQLLEPDGGTSFVRKLVAADEVPDDILTRAGLDAGLARCGFLKTGIREYLPGVSAELARDSVDIATLDRVLTLLEWKGNLRYDERLVRVELASALLRPFVDRPPNTETKERLQSFFVHRFGHPNLPSRKRKWAGVRDDVRQVLIRWLVERALDQFLLVLKETAKERHWRYRETFWKAFLEQDLIGNIWFVLGSRARNALWRLKADDGLTETTGSLKGAGSDQSVLIMRLPGVTIAEWSHNGSCRCWLDGNRNAPKLYKRKYHRETLTQGSDFAQPHFGSERGYWQGRVKNWLRENTGVTVDASTKKTGDQGEEHKAYGQSDTAMIANLNDSDLQWTAMAAARVIARGSSSWTFSYFVRLANRTDEEKTYVCGISFRDSRGTLVVYNAVRTFKEKVQGKYKKEFSGTISLSAHYARRVTEIRLRVTVEQ